MGVSIWLLYDGFFSFAVVWQFLNQHDRLLVGSAAYPIRIESCHALIVPIHRLRYEKPIFDVLQGLLIFGNVLVSLSVKFRILYNRQAILNANGIIQPTNCSGTAPKVSELPVTIHIDC